VPDQLLSLPTKTKKTKVSEKTNEDEAGGSGGDVIYQSSDVFEFEAGAVAECVATDVVAAVRRPDRDVILHIFADVVGRCRLNR
jgi:hypothetical protein